MCCVTGQWFTITVSEAPKVLETDTGDITTPDVLRAKEWDRINQDALLRIWRDEVDAYDAGLVKLQ